MFSEAKLENFRGVRRCKKPIKLGKFTLLIGANNSGKSTLLEALFFLPCPWDNYPLSIIGRGRLGIFEMLHSSRDALVYRYSGGARVECTLEDKQLTLEVSNGGAPRLFVEGQEFGSTEIAGVARRIWGSALPSREIVDHTLYIPNSDEFMRALEAQLVNSWSMVERTGAHFRVVRDIISKVVEDRFTEAYVRFNRIVLRKELPSGEPYAVRARDLGDGIERFLMTALFLEAVEPKVVLWDDLEVAAHPSLIRKMIEWLAEHDWQVVASTHSIDVLHEFVLAEPKGAKVIALRKTADDALVHKVISLKRLESLIESGQDVRKLMLLK